MSKGKFALGAVIGAAVGVVAGLLTAPKSGKETRADLKATALKAKDNVGKTAEQAATKAGEIAENVKTEAIDLKDRSQKAVDGAKKGFFSKEKK